MSTKPAKVAHRPSWPTKAANPGVFPETEDIFAKRSLLRGWTKVAKVGPPRARGLSAKVPPSTDSLRLGPPGGAAKGAIREKRYNLPHPGVHHTEP